MAKQIGVTQKTSWMMLHKIRNAFKQKKEKILTGFTCNSNCNDSLVNTVEIDETYVGEKEKNKHADKKVKNNQGRNTLTKQH